MTRVHLAQLLRDLLSPHGYHFFTAPDEYMPSEIDRYPAAWLTPPRLKEVEGRRHGKQVYELQLHLLQPGCGSPTTSAPAGSTKWSRRARNFTELTRAPKIIASTGSRSARAPAPFTNHGEISQSATAEVTAWF